MWPAPRVGADGARERPGWPGPEGPGTCFAEVWRKFDSFAHIPRLCRVLRSHAAGRPSAFVVVPGVRCTAGRTGDTGGCSRGWVSVCRPQWHARPSLPCSRVTSS